MMMGTSEETIGDGTPTDVNIPTTDEASCSGPGRLAGGAIGVDGLPVAVTSDGKSNPSRVDDDPVVNASLVSDPVDDTPLVKISW